MFEKEGILNRRDNEDIWVKGFAAIWFSLQLRRLFGWGCLHPLILQALVRVLRSIMKLTHFTYQPYKFPEMYILRIVDFWINRTVKNEKWNTWTHNKLNPEHNFIPPTFPFQDFFLQFIHKVLKEFWRLTQIANFK